MSCLSLYELRNTFKALNKTYNNKSAIKKSKVHVLFMYRRYYNVGVFVYLELCHTTRAAFV